MNNKKNLFFILLLFIISSCSFDDKTGIWDGNKKEKKRVSELELEQRKVVDIVKVYSSDDFFSKEVSLNNNIVLTKAKNNTNWKMSSLNYQNYLGNIYLSGIDNTDLKKKIGKNKFSLSKIMASPLIYNKYIFLSDDTGSIYKIANNGRVIWKKNIYKKIYKKIYKNLNFAIDNDKIYIVDNVGFIYVLSVNTGELIWLKNHGIPIKSNIKVFENKIYIINQDNRVLCLSADDGTKLWDIRSISSFIKSQNFLSLAFTNKKNIIFMNTSGDIVKVKADTGDVYWTLNTSDSILADATDFFKSSEIVIDSNNIIFSSGSSLFSLNLEDATTNWELKLSSIGAPIIDKNYIFVVTRKGYFVIVDKKVGKIISSNNILKILKKKKRKTEITGFIMGSNKIYSVTENGFLIVSSAASGKVEQFKKIGDQIISKPIISDGKLYILSRNSKLIRLN